MADETAEKTEAQRAKAPAPSFRRFLMIFLFILGLYVAFVPGAGEPFAAALGVILNPLLGFNGAFPVITILLAGILSTTISSILRHFTTDWVSMARANRTLSALRKDQFEAQKKGNQARVKKLREVQMEMMADVSKVQFASMKSFAYTFLFFVVLFLWLRAEFVDQTLTALDNLLFAVPWSFDALLTDTFLFPTWVLLYSLLAIPFSQIVQRVLKYVSFSRRLRAREPGATPEAPA